MHDKVSSRPAVHRHGGDIYSYQNIQDFSANINFRGMPESVRDAAVRAVDLAVHYPDSDYRKLRGALAAREQVWNPRLVPEQIVCGNGAAELMFALASCLRPRRALLPVPSFFEYEQALASCGCAVEHFLLREEDDFALDRRFADMLSGDHKVDASDTGSNRIWPDNGQDKIRQDIGQNRIRSDTGPNRIRSDMGTRSDTRSDRISPDIRQDEIRPGIERDIVGPDIGAGEAGPGGRPDMVILGNPNNPTGRLIESGELERILDICLERRIFVVLDESFFDFLCDDDRKRTFSGTECIDRYPNLMVLKSFTKMYAMPGLRFGYAVCSRALTEGCAERNPDSVLSEEQSLVKKSRVGSMPPAELSGNQNSAMIGTCSLKSLPPAELSGNQNSAMTGTCSLKNLPPIELSGNQNTQACGTSLAGRLRTVLQPWNVSLPAQEAACAAASELAFARETAGQVRCNREEMRERMEQAGFRVYPSATNYLLFCGPLKLKEECVKRGFLIRDCGNFPGLGPDGDRAYFRICIRSREENARLLEVLQECQE